MTRLSSKQTECSQELLARGRLALRVLQYRQQAARYMAEASQLEAAMLSAELGDTKTLEQWLDTNQTAVCEVESRSPIESHLDATESEITNDSGDIDSPSDKVEAVWGRMSRGAMIRRNTKADNNQPVSVREPIEETRLISLSDDEAEKPPIKRVSLLFAAHVWVSLAIHFGLVVGLSIVVISATKKQELLSIVSSPVEAENVLMETPMEMVSELETASLEPMTPTPTTDLTDVTMDVAVPLVAMEPGTQPNPLATSSSEVAQSSSSAMQGWAGSKMVSGVEFFGVKATGNTFAYIIDCSPSMRKDNAFQAAKNEVFRSLASMKPKQRYFISFFGKEIDPLTFQAGEAEKYPVYATKENVIATQEWMNAITIQKEGWPPNNALQQAIEMQPDGIFMLFDGDTKVDVAKFLRRINRTDDILSEGNPKVPIHVIHFFQEDFRKPMMTVAQENGGTYRFIPRPERPATNKR